MDYLNEYLLKVIPIHILELLAALAGSYYLVKKPNTLRVNKYFVYFIWYTFINEVIGAYAPIAYFSNFKYFGFIKDTVFYNNVWLYNIYSLLMFSFLIYYFSFFIQSKLMKSVIKYCMLLFGFISIYLFIYDNTFFKSDSLFVTLVGSIFLICMTALFYSNLLKSDKVLDLKQSLPVYISLGLIVFHLSVTPLVIFNNFFNPENNIFVLLRNNVLLLANIFMYSTFIIGFLVCSKTKIKD